MATGLVMGQARTELFYLRERLGYVYGHQTSARV